MVEQPTFFICNIFSVDFQDHSSIFTVNSCLEYQKLQMICIQADRQTDRYEDTPTHPHTHTHTHTHTHSQLTETKTYSNHNNIKKFPQHNFNMLLFPKLEKNLLKI